MRLPVSLLSFFCFALAANAQVSSIDSFYLPGSVWRTEGHLQSSHMCSNVYFSHRIERDSLINGLTYHLISGRDDALRGCWWDPMTYTNIDFGIFGGIRVDGRKVYFLQFNDVDTSNDVPDLIGWSWQLFVNQVFDVGVEKLIYDFDLPVGQAMPGSSYPANYEDSVSLLDDSLKARRIRFGVQTYEIEYWIDGVGSTRGIMGSLTGYPYFKLTCYQGATHSYPAQMGWCLWANTGTNEVAVIEKGTTVYPNPLQGEDLQIESDRTLTSLSISDMSGRQVANYGLTGFTGKVNTSLTPGIYVLRLTHADGSVSTQKLVKQ